MDRLRFSTAGWRAPRWWRTLRGASLGLALAVPLAAAAEPAFTRDSANLRAGPSTTYPAVVQLRPGQSLEVVGCTDGYGWCDVVLPDGLRGWVAASLLDYPWDGGAPVPLAQYGAMIGVPIVAFSLGRYWSDNYRDRPWYGERRWWGNRPPPPVSGWRPAPPPHIGWQPRPPRPGWQPPGARPPAWQNRPDRPPPGWQNRPGRPDRPAPGWQDRPHRPPPGWQGPPNAAPRPPRPPRPQPPQVNPRPPPPPQMQPRPPRPQPAPGQQPPGIHGRPGPGAGAGGPPPGRPGGARGTFQTLPQADRP